MTPLPLDLSDKALLAWLEARFDEQVDFLERLVNINSATLNFDGIRACASLLEGCLVEMGFACHWIDHRSDCNRAGHLVAERIGRRGRKLLLMGHIDTVHSADSPFQRMERHPGRLVGPGVEDMKNGDVVLIQSLRALHAVGLLQDADIRVVFTGDEEMPGEPVSVARAPLVEASSDRDVVLSFEPGEPGVIVTSRRGVTDWTLEVSGQGGHSGLLTQDGVGYGAIYEVARILDGFRRLFEDSDRMTINPNPLLGGSSAELDTVRGMGSAAGKMNVVSRTARVRGDLRCLSPDQLAAAKARMTEIVSASLPGTSAVLKFNDMMPPMAMTPGNEELRILYDAISQAIGGGRVAANNPVFRGGGDISFIAAQVPAGLDGLGGWGGDAHTESEWLDLDTFKLATKRAALLMKRLLQDPV